jgi:hypothetical protein
MRWALTMMAVSHGRWQEWGHTREGIGHQPVGRPTRAGAMPSPHASVNRRPWRLGEDPMVLAEMASSIEALHPSRCGNGAPPRRQESAVHEDQGFRTGRRRHPDRTRRAQLSHLRGWGEHGASRRAERVAPPMLTPWCCCPPSHPQGPKSRILRVFLRHIRALTKRPRACNLVLGGGKMYPVRRGMCARKSGENTAAHWSVVSAQLS